jgi:hypothetical protein
MATGRQTEEVGSGSKVRGLLLAGGQCEPLREDRDATHHHHGRLTADATALRRSGRQQAADLGIRQTPQLSSDRHMARRSAALIRLASNRACE